MRRFRLKQRSEERKEIAAATSTPLNTNIETNPQTLNKLISSKVYEREDIIECAKELFKTHGYYYEEHFALAEKQSDLQKFNTEVKKPFFVIYNKFKQRWVLLCLINNQEGNAVLLYKDPCGEILAKNLEETVKKHFPEVIILVQTQKDQDKGEDYNYGPLCLRNLNIMLRLIREDSQKCIEQFCEVQFAQAVELNGDRFSSIIELTNELAENANFKVKLKQFIDKLPLEWGSGMLHYKKVLEEELEKEEENVDLQKIKEAREKFLTEDDIKNFQENYKLNDEKLSEEAKEYELEIQTNFSQEMEKLSKILDVLDNIKIDEKFIVVLQNISEILDIDYERMVLFYQFKAKKDLIDETEELQPSNIDGIVKQLLPMRELEDEECTPLDQLLSAITLGMEQEDLPLPKHSLEDIRRLEEKYRWVKENYEKWQHRTIQDLHDWAVAIKGHLETSDYVTCETIAILDRAFNILTGGFRFRDTQILAVLIFLHGNNDQGRLCQIQTGEGKTNIVAFLAIIKVLQGHTVDVITSNPVLAQEGVDENKTFYSTFNMTVATNNVGSIKSDVKIGYTADVLYGTISNFQFDHLKDTFEGFNIRQERKFDQVILDEVDSMLVDNGGHIAKLASPYPGMECLRYIYIKIWEELHKAEKAFAEETRKMIEDMLDDETKSKSQLSELMQEFTRNERKFIREKIRASNPTNIPLIPPHLKEYVQNKLEIWLKNAVHAKYNCHEHQQYRIMLNEAGEKVITPVDYLNTGVTMKNTIWSNGLHQFIQLKHNLHLTFESLTSSFISNIGYIKKYQGRNIFGLTGTLGSRAEQELLSSIYNVDYAKLPTYKQKMFEEISGLIIDDSSWHNKVTVEVLEKVDEGRAVLVICETEEDLFTIEINLKILQNKDFRIRTYANEDDAKETKEKVRIGDIILATNIAGRGTNFKTEKDLEKNGGLHVCVAFLPCNLRVEGQAFGRTSRQGNKGTGQLIIRGSEVDELRTAEAAPTFDDIKRERDRLERERLEEINEVLVKELNFKDKLFGYFSEFHVNLKRARSTEEYRYVLQDLKEFWAFWLEKKNFNAKNLAGTTPRQEFNKFVSDAKGIIGGKIQHNPYYCIGLADYHLTNGDVLKAEKLLRSALSMTEGNFQILVGCHLKLFEIAIANGNQLRERFKKLLANIFFIDVNTKEGYKIDALTHLKDARRAITKEIEYMDKYLTLDEGTANQDLEDVLVSGAEGNLFLRHLYSRLQCLKIHGANIDHLIETMETAQGGISISGRAETTLKNFEKMAQDSNLTEVVTSFELTELQSVGLDAIYSLREVYDVPREVVYSALGQIAGGITALAVGLCLLPVYPLMSSIAGILISEGIMDVVTELLNRGTSDFDQKDYMKGKFISYGISLITFGISAITQSVKILDKAVEFCRKLSSFLRNSTYLKSLCHKLANLVDKLGNVLERMLIAAKFNKLSKLDQLEELGKLQNTNADKFQQLGGLTKLTELQDLQKLGKLGNLTKTELLVGFVKKTTMDVTKSIFKEVVVEPLLSKVLQDVLVAVRKTFKQKLVAAITQNTELMGTLQRTHVEDIDEAVGEFLEDDEAVELGLEISSKITGLLGNAVLDFLTEAAAIIKKGVELDRYGRTFASFLQKALRGGNSNNDVDKVVDAICSKVTDKMFSLLIEVLAGSVKGIATGAVLLWKSKIAKKKKKNEEHSELNVINTTINSLTKTSGASSSSTSDAYHILGLDHTASLSQVNRTFRLLALQFHPDKNPNDPNAQDVFKKIVNARDEILKTLQN